MTYGPFYLYDHPPASRQFYPQRPVPSTLGVIVHTSEGPGGPGAASALAGFIARRSDPGSYHAVVDSGGETVYLLPDEAVAFSVAASGYNSRTWSVCLAARSSDLDPDDPATATMIDAAGAAIADYWTRNGVDPVAAAQWIGANTLDRAGLACHGDVQPWDRSDAWSRHPDRDRLDRQLIDAVRRHTQTEDEMRTVMLVDPRDGKWWHCLGNTRVYLSKPEQVDALRFLGTPEINPAPTAWVDSLAILPRNDGRT